MPRSITLAAFLKVDELNARLRRASEPVERNHLRVISLLASKHAQAAVAALTGYSTRQIRAITKRYNEGGPEALGDQRRRNVGSRALLDAAGQAELALALSQPPPDGGVWTGRKVAAWIARNTGQE